MLPLRACGAESARATPNQRSAAMHARIQRFGTGRAVLTGMAAGATSDDETNFFHTKNVAGFASLRCCLLISLQFLFRVKQESSLEPS
jgi:hypothetical protein